MQRPHYSNSGSSTTYVCSQDSQNVPPHAPHSLLSLRSSLNGPGPRFSGEPHFPYAPPFPGAPPLSNGSLGVYTHHPYPPCSPCPSAPMGTFQETGNDLICKAIASRSGPYHMSVSSSPRAQMADLPVRAWVDPREKHEYHAPHSLCPSRPQCPKPHRDPNGNKGITPFDEQHHAGNLRTSTMGFLSEHTDAIEMPSSRYHFGRFGAPSSGNMPTRDGGMMKQESESNQQRFCTYMVSTVTTPLQGSVPPKMGPHHFRAWEPLMRCTIGESQPSLFHAIIVIPQALGFNNALSLVHNQAH